MQNYFIYAIVIYVCLFITSLLTAQEIDSSKTKEKVYYTVPKVNSKINVDAYLDEPFWQEAVRIHANIEVSPGENIEAPVKTEVLMAYDDTRIFVAFIAYDPDPSQIRARYCDRDNIWDDDWVLILFDTFNDQRRTYDFCCNPFGIQADIIETPTGGGDEWDALWDSDGRITDEGYIIEMAIPFSSLNFPTSEGEQIWGFDAVRSYPRSVRHHIGTWIRDRNNNCYMCQAEKLIGFAGASPGKNIELVPTFNVLRSQVRKDETSGPFVNKDEKYELGLTGKWGITPNVTLSGTVNPDFSNIEADILQLDINNQFAIYYPEKRPFFLESKDFFTMPFDAIHTRTMADPIWGVKLSGKEGRHSVGFFSVRDDITNFLIPGREGSNSEYFDKSSQGTALRYKVDIHKSSNIGLILSDREGKDYYNRMGGIDGDVKFTQSDRLTFQALQSRTQYPDSIKINYDQPDEEFIGNAYYTQYIHTTKDYYVYGTHRQVEDQFRADLGFMSQIGYKYSEIGGEYRWRKDPGYWYNWLSIAASYDYKRDIDDNLIHRAVWASFNYEGPMQSHINLNGSFGSDRYNQKKFKNVFYLAGCGGLWLSSMVWVHLYWQYRDQIDYANTQLGKRFQLNPSTELLLGLHLKLELNHTWEILDVDDGRLYTANSSYLKLTYQFTERMFLRAILQNIDYKRNESLYIDEVNSRSQNLFSQILFSYKINPRTVFFLGYSDNYYADQDVDFIQTNRTLFTKLGYSFTR
jgi:hypothetical protein